jgi:hypothetical protein
MKVAPLRYDVIFKKAFSVPTIFSQFVSDVIGKPVTFDRIETEKRFDHPIGLVEPRFDLYAENPAQHIIVDIQHMRYIDHYDRFIYYHCANLMNSIPSARSYCSETEIITIVVLTSPDIYGRDISISSLDPQDRDGVPLGIIPHRAYFLCTKHVDDKTAEPLRTWLQAIEDTLDEEVETSKYNHDVIQEVFGLIKNDMLSPAERARIKDENAYHDTVEAERKTLIREIAEAAQAEIAEAQRREAAAQAEIAALRAQLAAARS